MTINTLIEIMDLSFRQSKQTSASQENFLAKEFSARERNSSRAKATKHHYTVADNLITGGLRNISDS